MRVSVEGSLPLGVTAKDVILAIIRKIGVSGGVGAVTSGVDACWAATEAIPITASRHKPAIQPIVLMARFICAPYLLPRNVLK